MIKRKISSAAQVLYPSDPGYNASISHYIISSTTPSICSILPDTVTDVATIVSDSFAQSLSLAKQQVDF